MSHATNVPDTPTKRTSVLIDSIMAKVREEFSDKLDAHVLPEDQLTRLAEQVATLMSLGSTTSTTPTPVPFSGETPMKKHSTPHTAYSNRDSKTVLKVEELCLVGVRKGYTFSGNADDLPTFLHLLETRAAELGFSEALYIVKGGEQFKLCTGGLNGVSIADTRQYEKNLLLAASGGDVNAARLLKEHTFLRTVL